MREIFIWGSFPSNTKLVISQKNDELVFLWIINNDSQNLLNSYHNNKFLNQSNWISWKSVQNDYIDIYGKPRKVNWNNATFIHRSVLCETSNYTQGNVTIHLLYTSNRILYIDHHSYWFCHDHKLYHFHHHTTEHGIIIIIIFVKIDIEVAICIKLSL